MIKIQAASATWPGTSHPFAFEKIAAGLSDPVLGRLLLDHAQICPQHPSRITTENLDYLQSLHTNTRFRLHATPRTPLRHSYVDAVNAFNNEPLALELGRLSRHINAPAYSLHAGNRADGTLQTAYNNCRRLEDIFRCPVAIEGLYPSIGPKKDLQLLHDWAEYETLLTNDVHFAIDLSHLNIVTRRFGRQDALVLDLINHPRCIEIHVSDNDGIRDIHRPLAAGKEPWWLPLLTVCGNDWAPIFYEGDLRRGTSPKVAPGSQTPEAISKIIL